MTTSYPNSIEEILTLNTPKPEDKKEASGGENQGESGGSSDELWEKYLEEIEKHDNEMVERWKGEADSTIIFAGLFSAVVAVSIVESYKWLSPDSGNETVNLLTQISRRLVNISNGTPLEIVESSQPFKPTTSILVVNVMWFSSIVLCLAGSVFATLIQQSARRYQALTQGCPTPHERARLRTFLFNGIEKFKVDQFHQLLGMSMHISILVYCVGLLVYIFTIENLLGYFALMYLLFFYLIYASFTFTPIFFFNSPFGTPFTPLCWRLVHLCLFGFFSTLRGIADLFPTKSKADNIQSKSADIQSKTGDIQSRIAETWSSRVKTSWELLKTLLKRRVKMHRQWFLGGRQRSIEFYATVAPPTVDENTLQWILAAIAEKESEKELKNFAVWVSEYFAQYTRSDPVTAISEEPSANPIFGFRLRHLIKKCILENFGRAGEHKKRLRVGLECLWRWAWAYNQSSETLRSSFPGQVLGTDTIRRLRDEQDHTAGMIGRCFIALVEKKLAAHLNSESCRSSAGPTADDTKDPEACLSSAEEIFLTKPGAIGLANIVSLTRREMNTLESVPVEVLELFGMTVDILAEELTKPVAESRQSPKLKLEAFDAASFHKILSDAQQRSQASSNGQWLLEKLNRISDNLFKPTGNGA